jgi:hypothetical protein
MGETANEILRFRKGGDHPPGRVSRTAYSITSSARASSNAGTLRPSAFAALKLITRLAEQPLPYATLCPQYETIVDRRVRVIPRRTVAPAAAALQHMQDAADHSPVIHPVLTAHVRRKQRRNPVSSFSQRKFHRIFSALFDHRESATDLTSTLL